MSLLGNLLWLIAGGLITGLLWFVAGILMYVSVIGIPWGRACFVMGYFAMVPFGKEAISRRTLSGHDDLGTGPLGCVGNVIWFLLGGLWLTVAHILSALLCAVTIIGIPFAVQHLKLAGLAISPIGQTIVTKDVARAARAAEAADRVDSIRGSGGSGWST